MWSRPTGLDFIFCFRLWLPSHLLSAARHHIRDEKISPIFHFQIAPTSHSMNVFNSGLNEDTQIQKVHVLKVKHVDVHRKKHVFEAEGINKAQMVNLQDCLWTRIPHNFYYYCTTLVFFLFQFYLQSSSGLLKTQESKHDVQSNPSARRGEKKAAQIEADSLSDSDVVCKFIRVLLFLVLA